MKLPNDIVYIFKIGWLTLFFLPFFCILFIKPTLFLNYERIFEAYRDIFEWFGLQCIVLWLALFLIMPSINQLNRSIRYKKLRLSTIIILGIMIAQFVDAISSADFFNKNFRFTLIGIFTVSLMIWIVKLEPNQNQRKIEDFDHLIE